MNYFQYRSKTTPDKAITVGQREDSSLFLSNASFLKDEENRFESIEQIEAFLGDELEMIIRPQ